MASVGHIIVGMTAARVADAPDTRRGRGVTGALFWSLLSLLPDLDVIGFSLGIQYGDAWGHRGATHSLLFSLMLGVAVGLVAPWFRRPVVRTGCIATAVLISHALLDTLTDGGLGCALLWPFDRSRYFAPWNPIPVAPIGLSFLTPYGLFVSAIELALFGPLLWFAVTPSRARASSSISRGRWKGRRSQTLLLGGWVVVVWLITSRDPLRQSVVALALRDDTIYASGFSERALRDVKPGQDPPEVRASLGTPLRELVQYTPAPKTGCFEVWLEANRVVTALEPEGCRTAGIGLGTSRSDEHHRDEASTARGASTKCGTVRGSCPRPCRGVCPGPCLGSCQGTRRGSFRSTSPSSCR